MEHIKEAFFKVKQDINVLKREISFLNKGLSSLDDQFKKSQEELKETKQRLIEICDILKEVLKKNEELLSRQNTFDQPVQSQLNKPLLPETIIPSSNLNNSNLYTDLSPQNVPFYQPPTHPTHPTHPENNSTNRQEIPTNPAYNAPYNALKGKNQVVSIGNEGVPTDRQTNQQTNQQTDKGSHNPIFFSQVNLHQNSIDDAAKILDSLDNIKKEVRLKFKKLTDQEFLVFSTIYQLSEEEGYTDYKALSTKLNLTQSSIRDYVGRLLKKGIPLEKTRINNKTIHLSISSSLKKVASLSTILQLRTI